jgi:methionyl-tRNA formyltransferase
MRLLFLGTSSFAVPILEVLTSSSHIRLTGVVTRPDRPAGRGRKLTSTPVAEAAARASLPLFQPVKLKKAFREEVTTLAPDVILSAAYGLYLPEWFLSAAPSGVVNVHPSLLPELRGAAPVARAISEGLTETGVTFMLTDSGWDTGPVLRSFKCDIHPDDTTGSLESRLATLAASETVSVLKDYVSGALHSKVQDGEPSYADKITSKETFLDLNSSAEALERLVRAFQPSPGARVLFRGRILKIHSAALSMIEVPPGEVVVTEDGSMVVGCGSGSLELKKVQPESGKVMEINAFIRGYRPRKGEKCSIV